MEKKIPVDEIERQIEERKQNRIDELRKKSRPLEDLIIEREFLVRDVLSQTIATSIKPMSEIRLGGNSPEYHGGYINKIYLKVASEDNFDSKIEKINFYGFAPVLAGQHISVLIPKVEVVSLKDEFPSSWVQDEKFYLPRKDTKKEEAIQILIIDNLKNSRQLGTFRSVNYSQYFPEN